MTGKMTNQQRFDWYDRQLGELAVVPDRLIDITNVLDRVDLDELAARMIEVESLKDRVMALEKCKARGSRRERNEEETLVPNEQMGAMSDALDTLQVTVDNMAEDV
ncbi:hypothetical protein RchiOBHm_Chr6g0251961 [Rosa chinensis]|uniref:Uncharacterized protein n=1 Tax=Rosa chinensis TaxID=74649 RepID=A0A2P6PKX9_ROSCH|nr:hypothetical protein RchiOBHm_Chr6g0251961 [Rosa chinensis]